MQGLEPRHAHSHLHRMSPSPPWIWAWRGAPLYSAVLGMDGRIACDAGAIETRATDPSVGRNRDQVGRSEAVLLGLSLGGWLPGMQRKSPVSPLRP